ncbi:hypothetical protein Golax_010478, partial [Gossypium laxum]|nr:hypothetical protein [Gossypium laxum]
SVQRLIKNTLTEISLNSGGNESHPEKNVSEGAQADVDRNTKKLIFKEVNDEAVTDMLVELRMTPNLSWKDKLMGNGTGNIGKMAMKNFVVGVDEDLEFLEDDINRSIVNGIPTIDFSDRIQRIQFKEMETTVILKLLGRNIGYGALSLNNRINNLWKPFKPFQLMDIENGYFLAKFQCVDDYEKVLSQGPWLIYRQYLTVQPWTKDFNSLQPYPSMVMWLTVEKEYKESTRTEAVNRGDDTIYRPWVVVERKITRNSRAINNKKINFVGKEGLGSRFDAMANTQNLDGVEAEINKDLIGEVARNKNKMKEAMTNLKGLSAAE